MAIKHICDICNLPITSQEKMTFQDGKNPRIWVHLGKCFDDWCDKIKLGRVKPIRIQRGGILL